MDNFPAEESSARRKYKKSAITRDKIYKEAMALMSECGFQGTTIRAVCEKANVSVGTFYNYFHSKGDILHDIYYEADEMFRIYVAQEIADKPPLDQLRFFALRYAKLNLDTGLDVMRVLFNPENSWFSMRRPMQDVLQSIIVNGQEQGVLRNDISADELVENIFGMLRGVCYSWCVADASFDLNVRIGKMLDLLIEGITQKQ